MKSKIEKIKYAVREIKGMASKSGELAKEKEGLAIMIEQEVDGILAIINNNEKLKPLPISEIERIFGKFEYEEVGNGGIKIDPKWQAENMMMLEVNNLRYWVHKLAAPQFAGIFAELYAKGLVAKTKFMKEPGSGIFCPRHQNWDVNSPLSTHSWGVALDNNPITYPRDSGFMQHPEIVKVFEKWGFYSGHNFSIPDPMHTEFARFII